MGLCVSVCVSPTSPKLHSSYNPILRLCTHSVYLRVLVPRVRSCPLALLNPGFLDLISISTGSRNPYHQQLPTLRVPSRCPGKSPTTLTTRAYPEFSAASHANFRSRKAPFSGPISPHSRLPPAPRSCQEMRLSRSMSRWW